MPIPIIDSFERTNQEPIDKYTVVQNEQERLNIPNSILYVGYNVFQKDTKQSFIYLGVDDGWYTNDLVVSDINNDGQLILTHNDLNTLKTYDNLDAISVIIPEEDNNVWTRFGKITFIQKNFGQINIIPENGVQLISPNGLFRSGGQGSMITLQRLSRNNWVLSGEIAGLLQVDAPDVIRDLSVLVTDSTSVTLTWTAPKGDKTTSGTSAEYYLLYFSQTIITRNNYRFLQKIRLPLIPKSEGQFELFTVNNLDPNKLYNFAIVGVTEKFGFRIGDIGEVINGTEFIYSTSTRTRGDVVPDGESVIIPISPDNALMYVHHYNKDAQGNSLGFENVFDGVIIIDGDAPNTNQSLRNKIMSLSSTGWKNTWPQMKPIRMYVDLSELTRVDRIFAWKPTTGGGGVAFDVFVGTNGDDFVQVGTIGIQMGTWLRLDFPPNLKICRYLMFTAQQPFNMEEVVIFGSKLTPKQPQGLKYKNLIPKKSFEFFLGTNTFLDEEAADYVKFGKTTRIYQNWNWFIPSLDHEYVQINPATNFSLDKETNPVRYQFQTCRMWNNDAKLEELAALGMTVLWCSQRTVKWMLPFGDYSKQGNFKPIDTERTGGTNSEDPMNYRYYAQFQYQIAARYGSNTNIPDANLRLHPTEPVKKGLGLLKYMETWNEPDKNWEGTESYFSPQELAAFMSAMYDGHKGALGEGYGIKTADPSMVVVFPAMVDENVDYLKIMMLWWNQHRGVGDYPFDVFNVHTYSNSIGGQSGSGTRKGLPPENSLFKKQIQNMVEYKNVFFPNKEIWLSETGYDEDENSPQAPDMSLYPVNSRTINQVKADWLMRLLLFSYELGVDVCQQYMYPFSATNLFTASLNNFQNLYYTCGYVDLIGRSGQRHKSTVSNAPEYFNRNWVEGSWVEGQYIPRNIFNTAQTSGNTLNIKTSGVWTLGQGWVGNNNIGYTHISGTFPLLNDFVVKSTLFSVGGVEYLLKYNISFRTTGSLTMSIGGQTFSNITTSGYQIFTPLVDESFICVPTTDFDGTVTFELNRYQDPRTVSYFYIAGLTSTIKDMVFSHSVKNTEVNDINVLTNPSNTLHVIALKPKQGVFKPNCLIAWHNTRQNKITVERFRVDDLATNILVNTFRGVESVKSEIPFDSTITTQTDVAEGKYIDIQITETPTIIWSNNVGVNEIKPIYDLRGTPISTSSIVLTWIDKNIDDHYTEILVSESIDGEYTQFFRDFIPNATFTLTNLEQKAYYFRVRLVSVDFTRFSQVSDILAISPLAPIPGITNLRQQNINVNRLTIAWDFESSMLNQINGFEVYKSSTPTGTYSRIATVSKNTLLFQDIGLSADTTYYYKIRSISNIGFSDFSGIIAVTTTQANMEPPTILALHTNYYGNKIFIYVDLPLKNVSGNEPLFTIFEENSNTPIKGVSNLMYDNDKTRLVLTLSTPIEDGINPIKIGYGIGGTILTAFDTPMNSFEDLSVVNYKDNELLESYKCVVSINSQLYTDFYPTENDNFNQLLFADNSSAGQIFTTNLIDTNGNNIENVVAFIPYQVNYSVFGSMTNATPTTLGNNPIDFMPLKAKRSGKLETGFTNAWGRIALLGLDPNKEYDVSVFATTNGTTPDPRPALGRIQDVIPTANIRHPLTHQSEISINTRLNTNNLLTWRQVKPLNVSIPYTVDVVNPVPQINSSKIVVDVKAGILGQGVIVTSIQVTEINEMEFSNI